MKAFNNREFEAYKAEVQEKWGKTDAYKEHSDRTGNYSKEKWNALSQEMDRIMAQFAVCMRNAEAPASAQVQDLVKALQEHITGNYYHCTNEILAGLGQMYTADPRFAANIDQQGEGTAEFTARAIATFCRG